MIKNTFRKKNGFSLIELLVVISIMMLVVGGGIATYMNFNEKQTILEATNQLKSYLLQAQGNARNGVINSCTNPLLGYRVSASALVVPASITIQEICDNGTLTGSVGSTNTQELSKGISVSSFSVTYKVLHGGISESGNEINVTVSGNNLNYQFKINKGGELTTGEWI